MKCNCGDLRSFLHVWTHDLDGHVTVQKHLPLLTATLVLQREPGKVVVVWANIDNAAEPSLSMQTHSTNSGYWKYLKKFPVIGFTQSQTAS